MGQMTCWAIRQQRWQWANDHWAYFQKIEEAYISQRFCNWTQPRIMKMPQNTSVPQETLVLSYLAYIYVTHSSHMTWTLLVIWHRKSSENIYRTLCFLSHFRFPSGVVLGSCVEEAMQSSADLGASKGPTPTPEMIERFKLTTSWQLVTSCEKLGLQIKLTNDSRLMQ